MLVCPCYSRTNRGAPTHQLADPSRPSTVAHRKTGDEEVGLRHQAQEGAPKSSGLEPQQLLPLTDALSRQSKHEAASVRCRGGRHHHRSRG